MAKKRTTTKVLGPVGKLHTETQPWVPVQPITDVDQDLYTVEHFGSSTIQVNPLEAVNGPDGVPTIRFRDPVIRRLVQVAPALYNAVRKIVEACPPTVSMGTGLMKHPLLTQLEHFVEFVEKAPPVAPPTKNTYNPHRSSLGSRK